MKTKNNLNLDFGIETNIERNQFIIKYLEDNPGPYTDRELTTMADYILWGKDTCQSTSPSDYGLQTQWSTSREVSYEGLLESDTFNEGTFAVNRPLMKTQHFSLNRADIRNLASQSPSILQSYEELWRRIDELDAIIGYYEYEVSGKRDKLPRTDLLMRFTGDEQIALRQRALSLTQYQYLKARKALVEMRKDQYTLKDSLIQVIPSTTTIDASNSSPSIGEEIDVRPLGVIDGRMPQIWKKNPNPHEFKSADLDKLSHILWAKSDASYVIDFTEPKHVDQVIRLIDELQEKEERISLDESKHKDEGLSGLIKLVEFYVSLLPPIAQDIYKGRALKRSNDDIAADVNNKYGKHYRNNYISTLYSRDVVAGIAKAAVTHRNVVEELFFPERFKKCNTCGDWVLMDEEHFTRRKRSSDGFYCHCKECEREKRGRINEKEYIRSIY